jgi:hypothetical protein
MPVERNTEPWGAFGFEDRAFLDTRCASSRTIGLLPCRTRHWTNEPYLRRCIASIESCAQMFTKRCESLQRIS